MNVLSIDLKNIPQEFNLSSIRDFYTHEFKNIGYSRFAWKEVILRGMTENMYISMSVPLLKWYEAQWPSGDWGFRSKQRRVLINDKPTIYVDFTTPDLLIHKLTW